MHIPRVWASASGDTTTPKGDKNSFLVWGWGDDEAGAKQRAVERLQRVLDRVRRGDPLPHKYAYADRPLREEILQIIEGGHAQAPAAMLTRNSYGARVLNAARLLFLDIDAPPAGVGQRLKGLFGGSKEDPALIRLRGALQQHPRGAFRVYKTASGYRVMAVDREFDPAGAEAQALMDATGTDPAFVHLCKAQKSFRARLTPKPFRCGCRNPPGQYPRQDPAAQQQFAGWLSEYEMKSNGYATCTYLETIGNALPGGDTRRLLELHDRATRSSEALPLA